MSDLFDFCFAHDEAFLIPIEELGAGGLSAAFREQLVGRELVSVEACDLFDQAWVLRRETLLALATAAPDAHLPPRILNVLVVREAELTRPYYEPFATVSLLVYASDLEPATSSAPHLAFQLLLAERLGQTSKLPEAWLSALPLLLAVDEAQAALFKDGAARSTRPDRLAGRATADALSGLREHVGALGVPSRQSDRIGIRGTALLTTREFAPTLSAVKKAVEQACVDAASRYLARQAEPPTSGDARDAVHAYLRSDKPGLLVVAADGALLWDPERAEERDALHEALRGLSALAAQSLVADLSVVDATTQKSLALFARPEDFRVPTDSLEEAGGVYVHHERRLIAYGLSQPGIDVLREAAPPYHRLLLAARVAHEWGHLAVDAGAVRLADNDQAEFDQTLVTLRSLFESLVRSSQGEVREALRKELTELARQGEAVERLCLARVEDYAANLLSRRVLRPAEMESYVRTNIRTRLAEPIAPLRKLSRYAYEFSYLSLGISRDEWSYFMACSYFREEFIDSEITSEPLAREVFRLVGKLLDYQRVDTSYLR